MATDPATIFLVNEGLGLGLGMGYVSVLGKSKGSF